jgi:L-arabinose 1-dehydrogenase
VEYSPLLTGVIGLGVIAPYFLDAIERNPDCVLTAVCDHDAGRLGGHNVASYLDYRELLRREAIDLAVITLPNYLHEAAIEACLDSGVHVCCEKPLTLSRSSAQRLQAMAAVRDRVLTVASHCRHNGHLARLARQVSPARAAHVLVRYYEAIEEHSGDDAWSQDPARSGGGCLVDNGPNALDMARVVAGEMAVKAARLGEVLTGVEYRAQLLLLATAGAAVTVDLRWDYPGQLKDVTVFLDSERAALALTEAVTLVAREGVSDEIFAAAARHFTEAALARLLWTIAAINAWNRVAIATRMIPPDQS